MGQGRSAAWWLKCFFGCGMVMALLNYGTGGALEVVVPGATFPIVAGIVVVCLLLIGRDVSKS